MNKWLITYNSFITVDPEFYEGGKYNYIRGKEGHLFLQTKKDRPTKQEFCYL